MIFHYFLAKKVEEWYINNNVSLEKERRIGKPGVLLAGKAFDDTF